MAGMRISLDAAMRARDVSGGWRDDVTPARDAPDEAAAAAKKPRAEPTAIQPMPAERSHSDSPLAETASAAIQSADGGDQRRRADAPRRRQRTRLRRRGPGPLRQREP